MSEVNNCTVLFFVEFFYMFFISLGTPAGHPFQGHQGGWAAWAGCPVGEEGQKQEHCGGRGAFGGHKLGVLVKISRQSMNNGIMEAGEDTGAACRSMLCNFAFAFDTKLPEINPRKMPKY